MSYWFVSYCDYWSLHQVNDNLFVIIQLSITATRNHPVNWEELFLYVAHVPSYHRSSSMYSSLHAKLS